MSSGSDVIVAGGGIVGTMIAWHLAKSGASVTLVDPNPMPASAPSATWASAGGLRQQGRSAADQPLSIEAARRWAGLEAELGADLELSLGGHLHIAERETEVAALEARIAADGAAGIPIRLIEGAELRACAPELTPRAIAGAFTDGDGQAHPGRVARAAREAFVALGGRAMFGEAVTLLEEAGAVVGVTLGAERHMAPLVVVAAGAWSAELVAPLGLMLPLRWRALTMLLSDMGARGLLAPTVTAVGRNLSLKQLRSGQFMLGGRWYGEPEQGGYAARPIDAHVAGQWSSGVSVLPLLSRHKLMQSWAGAEAQSPDGNPLIGRMNKAGLYLCAGFSNHGFQVSPAIGAAVAADIVQGTNPVLAPFDPARLDRLDPARIARFRSEPILEVA